MYLRIDKDKLAGYLNDFSDLTGLSIEVLDTDMRVLAKSDTRPQDRFCARIRESPEGLRLCGCSDDELLSRCIASRDVVMHTCHSGLNDVALPIIKDDILLGYIFVGRIRMVPDASALPKHLSWMGGDLEEMSRLFLEMPFYNEKKIRSVMNLAVALATYLIVDDIVCIDYYNEINEVINYIENNLNRDLSIETLCSEMHTSKNVLYKNFRSAVDCTVNEYICKRRIELAKKLLSSSDKSLSEIAEAIGIDNPTYFPKFFKKHTGVSPSVFRKQNN